MSEIVYSRTGLVHPLRGSNSNPRYPSCPLHLKVICGVCPHFEGQKIRQIARCSKLGLRVDGRSGTGGCEYWERKTSQIGAVAPAKSRALVSKFKRERG